MVQVKGSKERPPGEHRAAIELSVQLQSHTSVIIPPDISVEELTQHSQQVEGCRVCAGEYGPCGRCCIGGSLDVLFVWAGKCFLGMDAH